MKNLFIAFAWIIILAMTSCAPTKPSGSNSSEEKKEAEVLNTKKPRPVDPSDLKGLTVEEIKKIQFYNSEDITLSRLYRNVSKIVENTIAWGVDSSETIIKKVSKDTPGRPVEVEAKNGIVSALLVSFSAEDKDMRFWFFVRADGLIMEGGKNGQLERAGGLKYNLQIPPPNICKLLFFDGVKRGAKTTQWTAEGDRIDN